MSKNLSAQARTEFEDEVKHQYDMASSGLMDKVRTKDISRAEDAYFPRFGKGVAKLRSARGAEDDVTGMGVPSDRINIALKDYEAPEYTDIFDQEKTNVDDRRELAIVIAGSMTRRKEQEVIDAMEAATYAANLNAYDTVTNKYKAFDIPEGGTAMTKEKINKAKRLMVDRGVTGMFCAMAHGGDLEAMLNDTTITSSDYNSIKALVDGDIETWAGFKWTFMNVRPEGGLPYTDNLDGTVDAKSFFWEKMAVGCITNLDRVEVNYIPEKTSWLSNGIFQCGGKVIDEEGLVRVNTTFSIQ